MKAKELIELLKKLNPEKEVMIQQGGEHEYMTVHRTRELQVFDENEDDGEGNDDSGIVNIIAIEFN